MLLRECIWFVKRWLHQGNIMYATNLACDIPIINVFLSFKGEYNFSVIIALKHRTETTWSIIVQVYSTRVIIYVCFLVYDYCCASHLTCDLNVLKLSRSEVYSSQTVPTLQTFTQTVPNQYTYKHTDTHQILPTVKELACETRDKI